MTSGKAFGERFAIIPDSVLFSTLSANAFRLFAILQRHSDVLGHCYPGLKRLAQMMGTSEDTIRRAKRELVDAGFLTCLPRYDDLGRQTTDDLFLHPPGSNLATHEGRTAATLNSKAVELEPDELEVWGPSQNRPVDNPETLQAKALRLAERARPTGPPERRDYG